MFVGGNNVKQKTQKTKFRKNEDYNNENQKEERKKKRDKSVYRLQREEKEDFYDNI